MSDIFQCVHSLFPFFLWHMVQFLQLHAALRLATICVNGLYVSQLLCLFVDSNSHFRVLYIPYAGLVTPRNHIYYGTFLHRPIGLCGVIGVTLYPVYMDEL
jgi:hypothetical protein